MYIIGNFYKSNKNTRYADDVIPNKCTCNNVSGFDMFRFTKLCYLLVNHFVSFTHVTL